MPGDLAMNYAKQTWHSPHKRRGAVAPAKAH